MTPKQHLKFLRIKFHNLSSKYSNFLFEAFLCEICHALYENLFSTQNDEQNNKFLAHALIFTSKTSF